MSNPYYRILVLLLTHPLHTQPSQQTLCMLVYHIRAGALVAAEGIDIRIVAVDQDTGLGLTQSDW